MRITILYSIIIYSLYVVEATPDGVEKVDEVFRFMDFYTDPQTLQFEGQQSYTLGQIADGLSQSTAYWVAAHRSAPAGSFPGVVCRLVRAGYLHAGFPDVEVRLLQEGGVETPFRFLIHEGERYQCGQITFAPNNAFSSQEKLKQVLATPPDGDASKYVPVAWKMGRPALMDEALNPLNFEHNVNAFLAESGSSLKGEVTITRQTDSKVADMHVAFKEQHHPLVVETIEVEGSLNNSREDILEYLQLKTGMAFDDGLGNRMEKKLRASARFLKHEISFEKDQSKDLVKMVVQLRDFKGAPPLKQTFSPGDKAILSFSEELQDLTYWKKDLVMHFKVKHLDTVALQAFHRMVAPLLAPNRVVSEIQLILSSEGFMLSILEEKSDGINHPLVALGFAPTTGFGFFLPDLQKRYIAQADDIPSSAGGVTIRADMLPIPDPEEDGSLFNFMLGLGFNTQHQHSFKEILALNIAPVASIGFVNREGTQTEINDGSLYIKRKFGSMELLMELDLTLHSLALLELRDKKTSRLFMKAFMQNDALHESMTSIIDATDSAANTLDRSNRFGSFLGLLTEWISPAFFDPQKTYGDSSQQAEIFARLVSKTGLLVERVWKPKEEGDFQLGRLDWSDVVQQNGMEVPVRTIGEKLALKLRKKVESDVVAGKNNTVPTSNPFQQIAMAVFFQIKDDLFPRGSWPWMMSIESMLLHERASAHSEQILFELARSSQIGPFGCLVASYLLETVGSRRAMDAALKGQGRLSSEQFEKDYRPILGPKSALGEVLLGMHHHYSQLDQAEKRLLKHSLENVPSALELLQKLDQQQQQNIMEMLRPEMNVLWEKTFHKIANESLRKQVFGGASY
jgi:hypothetical protein